ncbi:hypothetical protein CAPTEDRAFT_197057 [Capitella teleta]|uniref:Uncharacterized protein n=1 Tax=Capitella teleta TaxID=283909 RepID=R7V5C3_CAPTE|nr:hypothetical protein CAPTEDRAFT_197057 [Capitella teleta]|eukprot:ELU14063.1 hypothetical protein CAPTEDRAFT_197057 [Capitella teleta]
MQRIRKQPLETWQHTSLCINAKVMESLKLGPGLRFLNLGSGTGYLSTLAGLSIGTSQYRSNHGVEHQTDVVQYARERLESFKNTCIAFDEFEFGEPQLTVGNCLLSAFSTIYCGAACPLEQESFMKNLLKMGGILVMPLDGQLVQITRISDSSWETKGVLSVRFTSLVIPSKEKPMEAVHGGKSDALAGDLTSRNLTHHSQKTWRWSSRNYDAEDEHLPEGQVPSHAIFAEREVAVMRRFLEYAREEAGERETHKEESSSDEDQGIEPDIINGLDKESRDAGRLTEISEEEEVVTLMAAQSKGPHSAEDEMCCEVKYEPKEFMHEKIELFPVYWALKSYLRFYRKTQSKGKLCVGAQ